MTDDLIHGKRDKRGDWKPDKPLAYPPAFVWPARPLAFLKWIFGAPGFIWPWNLIYALIAWGVWSYLTPAMETMKTFSIGWLAYLLARNMAFVLTVFGGWHYFLYVKKSQQNSFKYNARWLSTHSDTFLFRSQTTDNWIRSLFLGVPVWTSYEALMLWSFANGYIPIISWQEHPVYCLALLLAIPMLHDVHFYLVHRFLHWAPMYRWVHSLHHDNVNPGPWSGLAMHPVEHILYFSGVLMHMVIPSHPFHALFHLFHSGLGPAQAHTGFDRVLLGSNRAVQIHGYNHYLHHKYHECNYADGTVPLDQWFGTFHDGSSKAQTRMDERFLARAAKANKAKA